ncbi:VOC family protein [Kitasatospora camelliae]|uniref:VOC family protein n=1 Tax=Kitasatospora camelliae TaxID=3156397 RepID=A0AAU8JZB3_9ACTN
MPSPVAELHATVLDCPDPEALAAFYLAVTGWEVTYRSEEYVFIGMGDSHRIAFQRVTDHRPVRWPAEHAVAHLDFTADDPEQAATTLVALGATRPSDQPGAGRWITLIDPAGHPLCLAPRD